MKTAVTSDPILLILWCTNSWECWGRNTTVRQYSKYENLQLNPHSRGCY